MPSTYRVAPYPAVEGTKRVFVAISVIVMIAAVSLTDRVAAIVVGVLCGWLPVAIFLHLLNFNRVVRHERFEVDESGIRFLRREKLLQEIHWDGEVKFGYEADIREHPGYFLRSGDTVIRLRDDFEPFEELLSEVSRQSGQPIPEIPAREESAPEPEPETEEA